MVRLQRCYREFGYRVRDLRLELGMTQGQLAKQVKLQRTSIANIEAGRQRVLLDDVLKFSKALGIEPEALCEGIWRAA